MTQRHQETVENGVFIGLLASLCLGGWFFATGCSGQKAPPPVKPVVPVTVAEAVVKDVPIQLAAIGTVEAYSTVSMKSQVSGVLLRVHFKEGQEVRRGELLFTIDHRPFEADLRRAEANLARDLAFQRQAEANLARDTAQAENARVETRRYERLIQAGVVAREQYDQIRTNSEAMEASLRADKAAIENAQEAIRADKAAIENARIELGYCTIRSPIDGRTGSFIVHEGNLVKDNDTTPLVVINQITPIYVNFSVPEQNLPEIRRHMAVGKVKVQAVIPGEEKNRPGGEVTFVDNTVDRNTGTIRLKGTFENRDKSLWPGQFVNVVLGLAYQRNAVVVPSQAVQTGQSGQFVFVISSEATSESRPVVAGRTFSGETVIENGLKPGEKVVTDGQLRLVPGARVEIRNANAANHGNRP